MRCEKGFPKMTTQRHPTALHRFDGVEGEEDSHGRKDDRVFTYHLESLDVASIVREKLGGRMRH